MYQTILSYHEGEVDTEIARYHNMQAQMMTLCTQIQTEPVYLDINRKLINPPFSLFKNYLYKSVTFDVDGLPTANFGFTKVYEDFSEAEADNF